MSWTRLSQQRAQGHPTVIDTPSEGVIPIDNANRPAIASPIQSLDRAALLLDHIAAGGALGVTLTALAAAANLKTSTAHSLLSALVANGLAEQSASQGTYRLGPKVFGLARDYLARSDFARVALNRAIELRDQFSETVFVSILRGDKRVDIVSLLGTTILSINPQAHHSARDAIPRLYANSAGKVLLAGLDRARAREILHTALPAGSAEVDAVLATLDQVREQSYAVNREEADPGVHGVAAPVRDMNGDWIAAVCIAFPSVRASDEYEEQLRAAVITAADDVSRALGGAGHP